MSDRVYASVFYIALIVGGSWIVVSVGESLARQALTDLALIPSTDLRPSRVDIALAAQDRAAPGPKAKEVLTPGAPPMPVGVLAKALDDAEQNSEQAQAAAAAAGASAIITRPRVAGWVKRLPKRIVGREESSGRIIMRTLRAEM
jgi:hypothetical protein